jgi:hypothetical protein
MKRLGPELKVPDLRSLKVPPVLDDLYQDLRDRRLLPLVGLILVAILAVPFLLGGGADEEEAVAPPPAPLEASTSARQAALTVVPAHPGLRDYRKRLRHRTSSNPFKPQYTGPVLAGTQLGGSSESATTTTTTTTESSAGLSEPSTGAVAPPSSGSGESAPSSPPTDSNGKGAGNGTSDPAQGITLYTFAVDVKITKTTTNADGEKSKPEELEKERVLPPAPLPGEKSQVVTYIGISPKTNRPLFLVSEEVDSIFGDVKCLAGTGRCQLLELEPELPVTFVTGEGRVRYKFTVLEIEPVVAKTAAEKAAKP